MSDYYPYGGVRIDEKTGSFSEQKKFTGYINDVDTGLNYATARYQSPLAGNFVSEDPVFIAMGALGDKQKTFLADPQQLNSYSYARDNPVVNTDPTGRCFEDACIAEGFLAVSAITSYAPQIESAIASLYGGITSTHNAIQTFNNPQATLSNKGMALYGIGLSVIGGISAEPEFSSEETTAPLNTEIEANVKQFGQSIYQGKVNLQPTLDAIESGELQPRTNFRTGQPTLYQNTENHSGLDYTNGNQYQEYNVINSGTPNNTAERLLIGTQRGDIHYSPDHYSTVTTIKK